MSRSRICVTGLALAALVAAPTASAIRQVDPKDPCKNGGWMRLVGFRAPVPGVPHDTGDRVLFRNQGQCVSFVNHGGVLQVPDVGDRPGP
jgi:hypothetical protein